MKKLVFLLVLTPGLITAQENEYLVVQNVMFEVEQQHKAEFEAGLAEHNRIFHNKTDFGARVYTIDNGPNTGNYIWSMAMPWPAHDSRPSSEEHDTHWDEKVARFTISNPNSTFWRWDFERSVMPENFKVNKLMVWVLDVEERQMSVVNETMDKVKRVYDEKIPFGRIGFYVNEMPIAFEGRDIAVVNFFSSYSWMSTDNEFSTKFEEIYGEGTFEPFIEKWFAATNSTAYEIWVYNERLSGLSDSMTRIPNQ